MVVSGPDAFSKLPDDLLVNILGRLVGRHASGELIHAQSVCKRWYDLAHKVDFLKWIIESYDDATALGQFLGFEGQSVQHLEVSLVAVLELPTERFLQTWQDKLPPRLHINLYLEDEDVTSAFERALGIQVLEILSAPRTRSLKLCFGAVPAWPTEYARRNLVLTPEGIHSRICKLELSQMVVDGSVLQGLLDACPVLEYLSWSFLHHGEGLTLQSSSLIEAHLDAVDSEGWQGGITLIAPNLKVLGVCYGALSLDCPNLEDLRVLEIGRPSSNPETVRIDGCAVESLTSLDLLLLETSSLRQSLLAKVVPNCFKLRSLTFGIDPEKPASDEEDAFDANEEQLSLGSFLSGLPKSLQFLSLEALVVCKLVPPTKKSEISGLPQLPSMGELQVEVEPYIPSYMTLHYLVLACPTLQKLVIKVFPGRAEWDKVNLQAFQSFLTTTVFSGIPTIDVMQIDC